MSETMTAPDAADAAEEERERAEIATERERTREREEWERTVPAFHGERLTRARERAGVTRRELAERTGLPVGLVAYYETFAVSCQMVEPTLGQAFAMAAALGCSVQDFGLSQRAWSDVYRAMNDPEEDGVGADAAFDAEPVGDWWKAARERLGLSVDEFAARARVHPSDVEAVEGEDSGSYFDAVIRMLALVCGNDWPAMVAAFPMAYRPSEPAARRSPEEREKDHANWCARHFPLSGARFRLVRESRGIDAGPLSEMADFDDLAEWEKSDHDRREPSVGELLRLAGAVRVDAGLLLAYLTSQPTATLEAVLGSEPAPVAA